MLSRRNLIKGAAGLTAVVFGGGLVACSSDSESDAAEGEEATDQGTSQGADTEASEIVVFAAASMTESLTEAADVFMEEYPQYEVTFNFDSSGTLKTQIQEGADCDVFISAGQLQMNQLDAEDETGSNTEGLDLIDSSTRFDILENKVALVVPDGNPRGVESFDQLAELLTSGDVLMAMGNSDVPVGQYTQLIFDYYGLDEDELAASGVLTYGTNVKEVTSQVSEGAVDCGVVYQTDAYSAGLTVVGTATADMCGQVVYPAAVTKNAPNPEGAAELLEFLKGDEASACFEEVGFTPLAD